MDILNGKIIIFRLKIVMSLFDMAEMIRLEHFRISKYFVTLLIIDLIIIPIPIEMNFRSSDLLSEEDDFMGLTPTLLKRAGKC